MSFYKYQPVDKRGSIYDLAQLKGKVVLVVNTASKCLFTPQLEGLEKLYKEIKTQYPDQVEFLGFPCDQFGHGDPTDDNGIQEFCQVNYGVSFPILGKIEVNGDKASPLYKHLKTAMPGVLGIERVKWNFEKFLIDKQGRVVKRWASTSKPEAIKQDLVAALR